MSSCADVLDVKGRWQAIGAQATEAFRLDGTFTAVDNQGMSVSGTDRVKLTVTSGLTLQARVDLPKKFMCTYLSGKIR